MYVLSQGLLVATASAVLGLGINDVHNLAGPDVRRERRRTILTTVYATGALLWVCLCLALPVNTGLGIVLAVAWPLVLMTGDLAVAGHHLPTQEAMANKGLLTQQSGNGIVAAVFAVI